ncbi:hypothetical protein NST63_08515 [Heyndrickxia sp. FSL W8-0496]|uniref:hypothetical protein n=1 Tax=Heyndrickxia TaxID=2837504 RepID=UPI0030F9CEF2
MKPKFQLECIDKECRTITIAKGNEHLDGIRCPRCNGPVLSKPFKRKPIKVTERAIYVRGKIIEFNKEHCFDLTPDQVETVLDLYDGYKERKCLVQEVDLSNEKDFTKLLVIELDSYDSVPRVLFEGEEIKRMIDLKFKWETDTSVPKPPRIFIKHAEKECGEKPIPIKTISFEPII